MKKPSLLHILLILLAVIILAISLKLSEENPSACFPQVCVNLEIARTPAQMQLGLMHRASLEENDGMLFIFPNEAIHSFWMKNTLIPLDMIWISKDNVIVHIETAHPCAADPCPFYTPPEISRRVIEVNAGFAEKHNIHLGDKIEFSNI